jgi:hypothetical protein
MKVKDLKKGDLIAQGYVVSVKPAPQPDRVIVEVDNAQNNVRFLSLFKDSEVDGGNLYIDASEILKEVVVKLQTRLEYGAKTYGEFWNGNDAAANLEEELLDALVYLWVLKRQGRQKLKLPYSTGDKVAIKTWRPIATGVIIDIIGPNELGQMGYVVKHEHGQYTAIASELSLIDRG